MLVAGLVLAISLPLAWDMTRPPDDVGAVPSAEPGGYANANANEPNRPVPAERKPGGGSDEAAPVASRSARLADFETDSPAEPSRVVVPSLGVDAPIVPSGVESDGAMELPADVGRVGWYRHGPTPGEDGTAVLAAHVDSRAQGQGVLFDLERVTPGATVTVTDDDGVAREFEVVARRTYHKEQLPIEEIFARSGDPRLVVITCGGAFDAATGAYESNVVVHAVPR